MPSLAPFTFESFQASLPHEASYIVEQIRHFMTPHERFSFLHRKWSLAAPFLFADSALKYERIFSMVDPNVRRRMDEMPEAAYKALDTALEETIDEEIAPDHVAKIKGELKSVYGFSAFSESPLEMLRRVERTGRIETEEEAEVVDHCLAGDHGGIGMSQHRLDRLAEIARVYYESRR